MAEPAGCEYGKMSSAHDAGEVHGKVAFASGGKGYVVARVVERLSPQERVVEGIQGDQSSHEDA
jgi:hypothetical protein